MSENKQGKFTVSREVKIGVTVIIALAMLYFGINYLKGINIFTPTNYYFLQLERVDEIVQTTHVMINGYQVGQVDDVIYDYTNHGPITVRISVDKNLLIPQGTIAEAYSTGLMGGKAIQLNLGKSNEYYQRGDTLPCTIAGDMLTGITDKLVPAIQDLMPKIDSLIVSVNGIVDPENSRNINKILDNAQVITAQLKQTSYELNGFMKKDLPGLVSNINGIATKVDTICAAIDPKKVNSLMSNIDATLGNLKTTTDKFQSTDNTLGLLLNDKSVYNNVNNTIGSANELLIDIKTNPKRYINVSVFGSKKDK
ncbi:MAG: MCE family protein [Paludibacteraceae bacterium]|nr:MCE family protein [Paludibacteraceae bacterium]